MSTPCLNAVERRVHRPHRWGPDVDTEDGNLECPGYTEPGGGYTTGDIIGSYARLAEDYMVNRAYEYHDDARAENLFYWQRPIDGEQTQCAPIPCPPIQEFRLDRVPVGRSIEFEMDILDPDAWYAMTGEEGDES